nr:hypothetical protein [Angustibacter aerolatus]
MRFTDGYWRTRQGFRVLHPAEVEQVEVRGREARRALPHGAAPRARRHAEPAGGDAHDRLAGPGRDQRPHRAPRGRRAAAAGLRAGPRRRAPRAGRGRGRRRLAAHRGPHGARAPLRAVAARGAARRAGAHVVRPPFGGAGDRDRHRPAPRARAGSRSASGRRCTAWASASAPRCATVSRSTSGTPTAAPAASRRTRTCRSC